MWELGYGAVELRERELWKIQELCVFSVFSSAARSAHCSAVGFLRHLSHQSSQGLRPRDTARYVKAETLKRAWAVACAHRGLESRLVCRESCKLQTQWQAQRGSVPLRTSRDTLHCNSVTNPISLRGGPGPGPGARLKLSATGAAPAKYHSTHSTHSSQSRK